MKKTINASAKPSKSSTRAKEKRKIKEIIDCEGFHYGLVSYSDFEDVKDERFHELLKAYRLAAGAIEEYLNL
jgi:adenine-specific DNA methylase